MSAIRSLLVVLSDASRESWARELLALAVGSTPVVLNTTPLGAAKYLSENPFSPSHVLLDIGARGQDVLTEIDQLAQHCEPGTRVLVVGDTNDIILYRGLLSRGVVDYLPMPLPATEIFRVLTATGPAVPVAKTSVGTTAKPKRVIAFISSASGDGASMAALNTAFALAQIHGGSTILVDMDYQYGMTAKNINLQNQYGIGDLFDHPDRGLDETLIRRMVANYGKLDVITAPASLRYLPTVSADAIRNLITILQMSYDNVVIDLPHVWLPWVAAVTQQSTHIMLVAQLWLKSVSHAARLMRVLRDMDVPAEKITTIINRSGAKFKEGIDSKDFERVCGSPIHYTLSNDIKTIVAAEGSAKTVLELDASGELAADINRLARGIIGGAAAADAGGAGVKGSLFSRLKG